MVSGGGNFDVFVLKLCSSPDRIGQISGSKYVCNGTTKTYSVNPVVMATGYLWTVPPGAIINAGQNTNSINVTFGTTSGNITVTPFNSCSNGESKSIAIKINPPPTVGIIVNPSSMVCAGTPVTLNGTGAKTYTWLGGIANGVSFIASTTKTYTVMGTDSNGCSNTDTITINVIPYPQKIIQRVFKICPGTIATLNAENPNLKYLWDTGDTTQTIKTSTEGFHLVKISNGFCYINDTITLINYFTPKPIITINNNQLQSTQAKAYQWYASNTLLSNETKQVLIPNHNGYYKVSITDSNDCTNQSDSVYFEKIFNEIKIYPNPSGRIFTIELPNGNKTEYTLQLFDALGQQVLLNYDIKEGIGILDVSHLASATYILRISTQSNVVAEKKLVKM